MVPAGIGVPSTYWVGAVQLSSSTMGATCPLASKPKNAATAAAAAASAPVIHFHTRLKNFMSFPLQGVVVIAPERHQQDAVGQYPPLLLPGGDDVIDDQHHRHDGLQEAKRRRAVLP